MQITDEHMETLRARLTGDTDRYQEGLAKISEEADPSAFNLLVSAAFYNAMRRRFGNGGTVEDIIDYVGSVRARFDNEENWIDAGAAEKLIRHSLGDGGLDGMDHKTIGGLQLVFLTVSVMDEELSHDEIDTFLASARELAES